MSGGGGGNHLSPVLSAPAAGFSEGDQGGALGQAYEGLPDPGDNGEWGRNRGGGVIRWGGVGGGQMSNLDSEQNGQSVDACLHQGRRVGSHVGEGGQQGYAGV